MKSEALARELEERLKVVCGHVNAAHAQLVDLVAEAIEQDLWSGWGVRSPKHWLTWQAGLDPGTAEKVLRLAAARTSHPATSTVFAAGGLSLDQAAIAVAAPPHVDTVMAELAPLSTVAQLRIEVRAATPAADAAEPHAPKESMATWFDSGGRYHVHAELDPDRGRVVDNALKEARDRLFRDGQHAVATADALVDIAERSLDATPIERLNLFRINVFIDPTADIPATWGDGFAVPESIRRLLTCEGTITPTFVEKGRPLSVAPTIKGIPDRIRRLVLARDKKCGCRGVTTPADWMSTTSSTAKTMAPRRCGTCARSAAAVTASTTSVSSASTATPKSRMGSRSPTDACSTRQHDPDHRPDHHPSRPSHTNTPPASASRRTGSRSLHHPATRPPQRPR